jgi:hypothetical protein
MAKEEETQRLIEVNKQLQAQAVEKKEKARLRRESKDLIIQLEAERKERESQELQLKALEADRQLKEQAAERKAQRELKKKRKEIEERIIPLEEAPIGEVETKGILIKPSEEKRRKRFEGKMDKEAEKFYRKYDDKYEIPLDALPYSLTRPEQVYNTIKRLNDMPEEEVVKELRLLPRGQVQSVTSQALTSAMDELRAEQAERMLANQIAYQEKANAVSSKALDQAMDELRAEQAEIDKLAAQAARVKAQSQTETTKKRRDALNTQFKQLRAEQAMREEEHAKAQEEFEAIKALQKSRDEANKITLRQQQE